VVNSFSAPVDVLVDGSAVIQSLASGSRGTAAVAAGSHTILVRQTGSAVSATQLITTAPGAGVLQVFRTQPDYQQPIAWQFPFTYQAQVDAVSASFYQSTVGSWEIRVWQTPADASGWATAPVKVIIPLNSGEKKTVLILDNPGGGVRVQLI